jgi:hypothetical protein
VPFVNANIQKYFLMKFCVSIADNKAWAAKLNLVVEMNHYRGCLKYLMDDTFTLRGAGGNGWKGWQKSSPKLKQ